VTVPEIAREILMRFGMTEDKDFEIRDYSTYEKRELYVQYEESDSDHSEDGLTFTR
jgi:uncharacterized protein involved in type VI secretion and phage assembly